MQENPPAGLYTWIFDIIAKMAPRGAIGNNIYIVNVAWLTINILSKIHKYQFYVVTH